MDGIQVQTGMTTIAVVGLGMAGMPGIAARVLPRGFRLYSPNVARTFILVTKAICILYN